MATDPATTSAIIGAATSVVVSLLSWRAAWKSQQETIKNQAQLQQYQKDLARLQAELADRRAEKDARRDYEYKARIRLYEECSPLLFQLSEQAAQAFSRIKGISESAAQGKLGFAEGSWLNTNKYRYYRLSTEYRLLAPMATIKLLQQRLTRLDLSLEPDIQLTYVLGSQTFRVMAADFELANAENARLEYDPHHVDAEKLRTVQPAIYWQQGVPSGILDNAVEALLVHDVDGGRRVMSYLEFETRRKETDSQLAKALDRISYLLVGFHPGERPVLWRILVATAALYRSIASLAEGELGRLGTTGLESLLLMPKSELAAFDWRADKSDKALALQIAATEVAVGRHLLNQLRGPVTRILNQSTHGN